MELDLSSAAAFLSHLLNINKAYQRVSPGKSAADSNLVPRSPCLAPAVRADRGQRAAQSPADGARGAAGRAEGCEVCLVAWLEQRGEGRLENNDMLGLSLASCRAEGWRAGMLPREV